MLLTFICAFCPGSASPTLDAHAAMAVDGDDHFPEAAARREGDASLLAGTSMAMIISRLRGLPDHARGADLVKIFNGYTGAFVEVTIDAVERERDRLRAAGRRDDDCSCTLPGDGAEARGEQCPVDEPSAGSPPSGGQPRAPARPTGEPGPATFSSRTEMILYLRRGVTEARVGAGEQPEPSASRAMSGDAERDAQATDHRDHEGHGRGAEGCRVDDDHGNDHICDAPEAEPQGVQAEVAGCYVATAREGPRDPPIPGVTASIATSTATIVDAVAEEGEAAQLQFPRGDARGADGAERGKAANGPTSGCAAPLEDSSATTGKPRGQERYPSSQSTPPLAGGVRPRNRRELISSLLTPTNLGARPSIEGEALSAGDGYPPPWEICEEAGWQW